MKFHEDRCKGEAVMPMKPFYLTMRLQTDGRTDRVIPVSPPNFVAGGIIKSTFVKEMQIFSDNLLQHIYNHNQFYTYFHVLLRCPTHYLSLHCTARVFNCQVSLVSG